MEVRRFYDRERKYIRTFFIIAVIIIIAGVTAIIKFERKTFKDYLVEKNYEKLYSFIENPDFSFDIFNIYMDYNYGGEINIISTEKQNNYIKYIINTDVGEKTIILEKKEGRNIWLFNDYVYDWSISLPKKASIYIENQQLENKDGEVKIDKLPFAVYGLNIKSENCMDYTERVLAGQKLAIKLDVKPEALEICQEAIGEYLNFKKNAINFGTIDNIDCVDKESGVYSEVIEQMEWTKNLDYKISKTLSSLVIEKGSIDYDGIISVEAVEVWETTIINENGENIASDKYKNIYFINPYKNFKIIKIKNEQA